MEIKLEAVCATNEGQNGHFSMEFMCKKQGRRAQFARGAMRAQVGNSSPIIDWVMSAPCRLHRCIALFFLQGVLDVCVLLTLRRCAVGGCAAGKAYGK